MTQKDLLRLKKLVRNSLRESLLIESSKKERKKRNWMNYEKKVIDSIKSVCIENTHVKQQYDEAAGSDNVRPDADIIINGKQSLIEVKMNENAYMGSVALHFDAGDNVKNRYSSETKEGNVFIEANKNSLDSMSETFISIINFINNKESERAQSSGTNPKKHIGFPTSGFTTSDWKSAGKKSGSVKVSAEEALDFIKNHYKQRGVHYIQIGKKGLYRLDEDNPLEIDDIPILRCKNGEFEVRAKTGGRPMDKNGKKIDRGNASLLVSPKLSFDTGYESPYTLDTVDGVKKIVEAATKTDADSLEDPSNPANAMLKALKQAGSVGSKLMRNESVASCINLLNLLFE